MENNDRTDNQRFALVLSWLQSQNSDVVNEQEGDFNVDREEEDDLLLNQDTDPQVNIFPRMTSVSQYELSRELDERYKRIQEQVASQEQITDDNVSDFEIVTDDNSFVSSHCWFLSSESSTPEISEPSKTDSDVYKSSSSNVEDVIQEQHKNSDEEHQTFIENTMNDQSLKIYQNVDNVTETDEDRILLPLRNNLLLRACILDLNDVPMSGPLATLVHNMHQFVFTPEESRIVLHFLRYRVVTTIQEINQRIDILLQSQRDAQTELDTLGPVPIEDQPLAETPELDDSVAEDDEIGSEVQTPTEEESEEGPSTRQESVEVEIIDPHSRENCLCPGRPCNVEDSLEVESSFIIIHEPMDDMNDGYTLRVIEILNEMAQLTKYREKVALLRSRKEILDENELRVVRNYLKNTKSRRGFWYRLKKYCFRTRGGRADELPEQHNSIQLFSCWRRRRRDR